MRIKKLLFFLTVIFLFLTTCKDKRTESALTVFAAAGASAPIQEIVSNYSKSNDLKIELNIASSGVLARQIQNGAQTSFFISANKEWMDYLTEMLIIRDSSIHKLARNKLVIIRAKESTDFIIDFKANFNILNIVPNKIAIGDPNYVPAGKYAEQVLKNLTWDKFLDGKILLSKDVVSVLKYVEMGECDWGIVYKSTALQSENVLIVSEIPSFLYSPVVFYISKLNNENEHARIFYDYLFSEQSKRIFEKHGFITEWHE